jgi:hypothetical protein
MEIISRQGADGPIAVSVRGETVDIQPGATHQFPLSSQP